MTEIERVLYFKIKLIRIKMDKKLDSDKMKNEEMNELFKKFHSKMLVLMKKQSKLIERAINLVNRKKIKEARDKIKKL